MKNVFSVTLGILLLAVAGFASTVLARRVPPRTHRLLSGTE